MGQFAVGDPATWAERGYPTEDRETSVRVTRGVETLAEAQGVRFLCPACYEANGGPIGTHTVCVAFEGRGVPPALGSQGEHGPSRWSVSGHGLDDLTLSPSIDGTRGGGCRWHGWVQNGVAT